MNLKHLKKHNLSKEPNYRRWAAFVQRCFNPKSTGWNRYGGRGISIDIDWNPFNEDGLKNFLKWAEEEIEKFYEQHPNRRADPVEVGRKDVNGNYGPGNCEIRFVGGFQLVRRTTILTGEKVVAMRRYRKVNPKVSLTAVAVMFDESISNTSRALRGDTWKSVNHIEPPVSKHSKE